MTSISKRGPVQAVSPSLAQDVTQGLISDANQQLSSDANRQLSSDANQQLNSDSSQRPIPDSNQYLTSDLNQRLNKDSNQRTLAIAFAGCSLLILAALLAHPQGGGHTMTEILEAEVRSAHAAGLVHGGFIVISAILIACFASLSRILGVAGKSVTLGFVAFCVGAAALMMSMTLDGLVVPALAARCLTENTAESLASARTLFLFAGACISVLMRMGLAFEGAAMFFYSLTFVGGGTTTLGTGGGIKDLGMGNGTTTLGMGGGFKARGTAGGAKALGIYGLAAGIAVVVGALIVSGLNLHLVIGGFLLLCVWYLGLAGLLWPRPSLEIRGGGASGRN